MRVAVFTDNDFDKMSGVTTTLRSVLPHAPADVRPRVYTFSELEVVHTRWSDGRLTLREVVDLYGETGKFDVIAITDHILMKKDLLARIGRVATLGTRNFGLREETFDVYLAEIQIEARRAWRRYGLLVIPGAEVTQNSFNGKKNSHIIALDIKECTANRDDLFFVTSLKHYPYVANSDFHKPKTCIRGRRCCAATRAGPRSSGRSAVTWTSPSPYFATAHGLNRDRLVQVSRF